MLVLVVIPMHKLQERGRCQQRMVIINLVVKYQFSSPLFEACQIEIAQLNALRFVQFVP